MKFAFNNTVFAGHDSRVLRHQERHRQNQQVRRIQGGNGHLDLSKRRVLRRQRVQELWRDRRNGQGIGVQVSGEGQGSQEHRERAGNQGVRR